MFAADGVSGLFACGIGEQLDTYVLLKFLDDPSQDLDALLSEFFTRYYGAAGEPIQRVYTLIERTYGDRSNYPNPQADAIAQTEEIAWGRLGTAERMDKMAKWMEEARAAKLSDAERQRLDIFDKGPWKFMVEGRQAWLPKAKHVDEVDALKQAEPPTAKAPSVPEAGGDLAKVDWAKAGRLAVARTHEGFPAGRQIAVEIAHDAKWFVPAALRPGGARRGEGGRPLLQRRPLGDFPGDAPATRRITASSGSSPTAASSATPTLIATWSKAARG